MIHPLPRTMAAQSGYGGFQSMPQMHPQLPGIPSANPLMQAQASRMLPPRFPQHGPGPGAGVIQNAMQFKPPGAQAPFPPQGFPPGQPGHFDRRYSSDSSSFDDDSQDSDSESGMDQPSRRFRNAGEWTHQARHGQQSTQNQMNQLAKQETDRSKAMAEAIEARKSEVANKFRRCQTAERCLNKSMDSIVSLDQRIERLKLRVSLVGKESRRRSKNKGAEGHLPFHPDPRRPGKQREHATIGLYS